MYAVVVMLFSICLFDYDVNVPRPHPDLRLQYIRYIKRKYFISFMSHFHRCISGRGWEATPSVGDDYRSTST